MSAQWLERLALDFKDWKNDQQTVVTPDSQRSCLGDCADEGESLAPWITGLGVTRKGFRGGDPQGKPFVNRNASARLGSMCGGHCTVGRSGTK